jgi:segregation and condensation protein A
VIHNFCINDFEGPLDLLLHLIRSSKMDIYDINIESITKQYLDIITECQDNTVDDNSEYLVMAAELIHLKSKLLIKKDDDCEEDDLYEFNSEEDLRNKLLEYENVKKLTGTFQELEDRRSEIYTKMPSDLSEYREETESLKGELDIDDLVNAFELFLSRQKLNKPLNTTIARKELSVHERTMQIRQKLKSVKKCSFTDFFEVLTKPYVVVTFLSILEMSKNKELIITQEENCGEIMLEMK